MNPLRQLLTQKQSFWLDFISRDILVSGKLKKMIQEDGLRGMTSNPTIFEKAISTGSDYDGSIKKAAAKYETPEDIFLALAIEDIQKATDIFKPVFSESAGQDGFVSLEVNPNLAYNTEGTTAEAIALVKRVKRPNLMIKIPGTAECIKSIEDATFAGVNVNITLLFSVESYKQVVNAYLTGLERRVKKGLPIKKIVSVASFFVSRVDTSIDKMLDAKIAAGGPDADKAKNLLHKAAIANAKLAYAYYEEVIASPRFQKLKAKGANVQRLLWGSTGTKDKRMSDVAYLEELIGPETVNTIPPATAEAFKDHGKVALTLTTNLDQAQTDIDALSDLGISLDDVTSQLQKDGVKSFIKSYDDLLSVVGAKRELLVGQHDKKETFNLGKLGGEMNDWLQRVEKENWIDRIWNKDAALWKKDADHQKIILNSLGWLRVTKTIRAQMSLVDSIVADVRKAKFTHALLLGMGGSSLAPEVLRLTFGKKTGYPDLAILDSTEPASVWQRFKRSKPSKTLYIVSSKSGSTTEPNAFLSFFYDQVKKEKGERAGENFIAITDPGTHMEKVAREKKFRHVVLNPSDIGGRYSALSFFGMLPAAIMGIDVQKLLTRAQHMADACSSRMPVNLNPGARLGTALGLLAKHGRDKVTFTLSKDIASFSTWVEQLIAESTGKEGRGILPVESEQLMPPADYGNDRVFVSIRTNAAKNPADEKKLQALQKAGHPVIRIVMNDKFDLPAEFFRWEIATAIAGAFLDIDPFDQPNVQEAKDLTKQYIEKFREQGRLPEEKAVVQENGVSVYATDGITSASSVKDVVSQLLTEIKPGDYVALLAYLTRDPSNEALLQSIRKSLLESKKVATTVGFGPRFLHSTGQLHKGGANNGVFIEITAADSQDVPIPGEPFSYSVLKNAQALGDFSALANHGRRAIRIHLSNSQADLKKLVQLFKAVSSNQ